MKLLAIFISILAGITSAYNFEDCPEKPLGLAEGYRIGEKLYPYSLDYFFHKGLSYGPIYTFTDVLLQINLTDPDSYQFYQGGNCTLVKQAYDNDNRYFGLLKRAAMMRSHHISPFNDTIVGVSTTLPYKISVQVWKVNFIRVAAFVGAILLFLLSGSLVRNVVFYYTSGCSFGILASLLLVAFIVWRVAPKKTIGIPVLVGGWSVSLYMLHFAWTNLQSIMIEYQKYVIGYFATVLLVSLAVCYKRGPPTDERSHDIAQWTLQLVALVIIYFSSQVFEVSLGTMLVLIIQELSRGYLFSAVGWYFAGLRSFWNRLFPKSRSLLTEEEYEEEGKRVTLQELNNLKNYCRQAENRPWKLAGNVRSARRLARFVEGEDGHVTEDEIYAHDMTAEFLDRDNYRDEDDFEERTPLRSIDRYGNDLNGYPDDEDEWDEVVVRRHSRGNPRPASVQSVRVPRSVSSRLLNQTFNNGENRIYAGRSSGLNFDSFDGRNRLATRQVMDDRSRSPERGMNGGGIGRRVYGAYTDVRPSQRSQHQRSMRKFDAEELEMLRAEMMERKERNLEEERRNRENQQRSKASSSSSSVASSVVSRADGRARRLPRISARLSTRREDAVGSESDDGADE